MRPVKMEQQAKGSGNFTDAVIAAAKKTFQPGREQLKNDLKTLLNKPPLAVIKDKRFLRNAHWLRDTNFIAARGPHSEMEMADFFTDTVYNEYKPIHHVIALGHCLAYSDHTYQDFYDYIIKQRETMFGQYLVSIKLLSGKSTTSESAHQIFPQGVIRSQLLIRSLINVNEPSRQLDVTLIELRDNHALDLRDNQMDPLKEILWQHFLQSLKAPILVHCAAGLGRTGHLILTFEILKYYSKIFENPDPVAAAAEIHRILNEMRSSRPGMVLTEQQFECAIRNANILHSFALEKEYITASIQHAVNVSSMTLFNQKSAPEQHETQPGNMLKI